MIAKPGFWLSLGTSLSLNLTFLKPAQIGDVLLLEAEVRSWHACCLKIKWVTELTGAPQIIQATSRLAILRGVLRREKDGVIVSTSEQVRNNIDKPKSRL
jgi:acyl-coenzyme A thioesterase 13